MEHDEIDFESFVQACEELGYDPETTVEGEHSDVDERAYVIQFNKWIMKAEAASEGDR